MAAHGNGTTVFAQMLHLWRTVNKQSLRDLRKQTGISAATMMRIEHGHAMDAETWLGLQLWLFDRIGPSPRKRKPSFPPPTGAGEETT